MRESAKAFKYPECKKGDYHTGESLSLICLESKCIEDSVMCGMCYNDGHKNHKIKPIKMVINGAEKYLSERTQISIDAKSVQDSIQTSKNNILTKYDEFELTFTKLIRETRARLGALFAKLTEQVEMKTSNNEELLKALNDIREQEIEADKFIAVMKKVLVGVPSEEDNDQEISEKEIISSVESITKKVEKDLSTKTAAILEKMNSYMAFLDKTLGAPSIFSTHIDFKFSQELKHQSIEVVEDNYVKSKPAVNGMNYSLCLMEPSIQEKGNKARRISFKIHKSTSNWLAVGLCHKNIAEKNSFTLPYSQLGHGGYMVSTNGGTIFVNTGSWSSLSSTKNNVVTSFHYTQGDTINISYEPDETKIVFSKAGTTQNYTLEYDPLDEDELHLCCLFYYPNDEIEFMGPCE